MTTAIETKPETVPDKEPVKAEFAVTPELLADVQSRKTPLSGFPMDQRHLIMEALSTQAPVEKPETVPDKGTETKVEEPVKAEIPSKGEFKKVKKTARDWAAEANTAEQRAKAAEERVKLAEAKMEEIKTKQFKAPDDPISDTSLNELHLKNARLEEQVGFLLQEHSENRKQAAESARERTLSTSQKAGYAILESLQEEFPDMQTEKPVQEVDQEFKGFLDAAVEASGLKETAKDMKPEEMAEKAFELVLSDPEFQKKVKVPFTEDLRKHAILLEAYNKSKTQGGSPKANLLERLHDSDILPEMFNRAKTKSAQDATRRMSEALNKNGELRTISPTTGVRKSASDDGMTEEKARGIMRSFIDRKNARGGLPMPVQDVEVFRQARDWLITSARSQ